LLASVFGPQSTVTVATSPAIGSVTVSPITVAILERSRAGRGFTPWRLSLIDSLKQPIVWAPLLGLAFSYAGLNLPSDVHRSLAVMGSAADASALVLPGRVVAAQKFEIGGNTLGAVLSKNAFPPAPAFGVAALIHLSIQQMRYVTLISAKPCGFFGSVFGRGFDSSPQVLAGWHGCGTLAAGIVIVNHHR
jgi:malonate transporter and related proteins